MKIDLSEKMLDLEGKDAFNGETVGRVLAKHLMGVSSKQPVRAFKVAMALLDDKEIEIDNDDYELIHEIVEFSNLSNIVKARILIKLEEGKDAK